MRNNIIRRIIILLVSAAIVLIISLLLNRMSFSRDFSVLDAITSATRRAHGDSSEETEAEWGYSTDELMLTEETEFVEKTVDTGNGCYVLLERKDLPEDKLIILSDKNNSEYAAAVRKAAAYFEKQGFSIEIREYSETMMVSLAHAGHFDLFLLREENGT